MAIRFGDLKDSSLVAKKLKDMRIVCCASPEYLILHGKPKEPAALATYNCLLQTTSGNLDHWEFRKNDKIENVSVNGNFRANSPLAIAHMAAGGMKVGRIPLYTAEPFLAAGRLKLLFESLEAKVLGLYVVYPPSRHLTARIRALIDHLSTVS